MSLTLTRTDLLKELNFIDGHWRDCISGFRHEVADPATGATFASVPDSSAVDAHNRTVATPASSLDRRSSASHSGPTPLVSW